jgi:hypothetical protein
MDPRLGRTDPENMVFLLIYMYFRFGSHIVEDFEVPKYLFILLPLMLPLGAYETGTAMNARESENYRKLSGVWSFRWCYF